MSIDENQSEDLLQNAAAREITQEIMRFGVSQPQIMLMLSVPSVSALLAISGNYCGASPRAQRPVRTHRSDPQRPA